MVVYIAYAPAIAMAAAPFRATPKASGSLGFEVGCLITGNPSQLRLVYLIGCAPIGPRDWIELQGIGCDTSWVAAGAALSHVHFGLGEAKQFVQLQEVSKGQFE